eukprot:m.403899 g.403899  ORF g.403899 m.403899 type:complete len:3205 (-) comp20124_c0_seq3:182-9796(-)
MVTLQRTQQVNKHRMVAGPPDPAERAVAADAVSVLATLLRRPEAELWPSEHRASIICNLGLLSKPDATWSLHAEQRLRCGWLADQLIAVFVSDVASLVQCTKAEAAGIAQATQATSVAPVVDYITSGLGEALLNLIRYVATNKVLLGGFEAAVSLACVLLEAMWVPEVASDLTGVWLASRHLVATLGAIAKHRPNLAGALLEHGSLSSLVAKLHTLECPEPHSQHHWACVLLGLIALRATAVGSLPDVEASDCFSTLSSTLETLQALTEQSTQSRVQGSLAVVELFLQSGWSVRDPFPFASAFVQLNGPETVAKALVDCAERGPLELAVEALDWLHGCAAEVQADGDAFAGCSSEALNEGYFAILKILALPIVYADTQDSKLLFANSLLRLVSERPKFGMKKHLQVFQLVCGCYDRAELAQEVIQQLAALMLELHADHIVPFVRALSSLISSPRAATVCDVATLIQTLCRERHKDLCDAGVPGAVVSRLQAAMPSHKEDGDGELAGVADPLLAMLHELASASHAASQVVCQEGSAVLLSLLASTQFCNAALQLLMLLGENHFNTPSMVRTIVKALSQAKFSTIEPSASTKQAIAGSSPVLTRKFSLDAQAAASKLRKRGARPSSRRVSDDAVKSARSHALHAGPADPVTCTAILRCLDHLITNTISARHDFHDTQGLRSLMHVVKQCVLVLCKTSDEDPEFGAMAMCLRLCFQLVSILLHGAPQQAEAFRTLQNVVKGCVTNRTFARSMFEHLLNLSVGYSLPPSWNSSPLFGLGVAADESPPILQHPDVLNVMVRLVAPLARKSDAETAGLFRSVLSDIHRLLMATSANLDVAIEVQFLGVLLQSLPTVFANFNHTAHDVMCSMVTYIARRSIKSAELRHAFHILRSAHMPAPVVDVLVELAENAAPGWLADSFVDFFHQASVVQQAQGADVETMGNGDAGVGRGGLVKFSTSQDWPPARGFSILHWFQLKPAGAEDDVSLFRLALRALQDFKHGPPETLFSITAAVVLSESIVRITCTQKDRPNHTFNVSCRVRAGAWHYLCVTRGPLGHSGQDKVAVLFDGVEVEQCPLPAVPRSSGLLECVLNPAKCEDWCSGTLTVLGRTIWTATSFLLYACGPNVNGFPGNTTRASSQSVVTGDMLDRFQAAGEKQDPGELVAANRSLALLTRDVVLVFRPSLNAAFAGATTTADDQPYLGRNHQQQLNHSYHATVASNCTPVTGSLVGPLRLCRRTSLREAVHDIGGVSVLLYFLAACPAQEAMQAKAMRLLFSSLLFSPQNIEEMQQIDGYNLLARFMQSEHCVLGFDVMDAVLAAVVGSSERRDARVVQNVEVLRCVAMEWRIWQRAPLAVWETLVGSLVTSVDPEVSPHSTFNARRFREASVIETLLYECQRERNTFPGSITLGFVRMLHLIMEQSPPTGPDELLDVRSLVEFLVVSLPKPAGSGSSVSSPVLPPTPTVTERTGNPLRTRSVPISPMVSDDDSDSEADVLTSTPSMQRTVSVSGMTPRIADASAANSSASSPPSARRSSATSRRRSSLTSVRRKSNWLTPCSSPRGSPVPQSPTHNKRASVLAADESFFSWWRAAEEHSEAETSVRVGMVGLLYEKLLLIPPSHTAPLAELFSPSTMVAMFAHEGAASKVTALRIIDRLFRLGVPGFDEQFDKRKGFHALANLIQPDELSQDMLWATCDMLTGQVPAMADEPANSAGSPDPERANGGHIFANDDHDDPDADMNMSSAVSQYKVLPLTQLGTHRGRPTTVLVLFACLQAALGTPVLCLRGLQATHAIFVRRPDLRPVMLANNLVSVICDVVARATSEEDTDPMMSLSAVDEPPLFLAEQRQELLVLVETFLKDVTRHAHTLSPPVRGVQLVEDTVDCLSTWHMPQYHSRHLQRTVVLTAMDQFCMDVTGEQAGAEQRAAAAVALASLCTLAVDLVMFCSEGQSVNVPQILRVDSDDAAAAAAALSNRADSPQPPDMYGYRGGFAFVCHVFHTLRGVSLSLMELNDTAAQPGPDASFSVLEQLGRLVVQLLEHHNTSHGEFVLSNLLRYPKLHDALCTDTSKAMQLFLCAYNFYVRCASAAGSKAYQEQRVGQAAEQGGGPLQGGGPTDAQLLAHDIMLHFVHHHQRMLQILVDVADSSMGDNGKWDLRFYSSIEVDKASWNKRDRDARIAWVWERAKAKQARVRRTMEDNRRVSADRMALTSDALMRHHREEKRSLATMQERLRLEAASVTGWRRLSQKATASRAVWELPSHTTWMLSPSEGPQRLRLRLQRCTVISGPSHPKQHDQANHIAATEHMSGKERAMSRGSRRVGILRKFDELVLAVDGIRKGRGFDPLSTLDTADRVLACRIVMNEARMTRNKEVSRLLPSESEFEQMVASGCFNDLDGSSSYGQHETASGGLPSIVEAAEPTDTPSDVEPTDGTADPTAYLYAAATGAVQFMESGLQAGEQLVHVVTCQVVNPFVIRSGELLIGRDNFYFKEESQVDAQKKSQSVLAFGAMECNVGELPYWPLTLVKEVYKRRYLLQHNSLEIFLSNGTTLLVVFESTTVRDEVIQQFSDGCMAEFIDNTGDTRVDAFAKQWQKGTMSNFEYIMTLNKLAGRTFNDLTQYPVFPFVLADFTSAKLDLNNPHTFRDLTKPMGCQSEQRMQKFLQKYSDLLELDEQPYHFGSHYSNAGSVLHYLVRLEPFTQLFLELQGGKFDVPDRTFHNLKLTWHLSSAGSSTDVKELVPEFFCLPEFLVNANRLQFGAKQDGSMVDDVVLPPWANGDARTFIREHRRALESPYVTARLHEWINLVFGFQQRGQAAVDAINCFHPLSYEGTQIDAIDDPVQRAATWSIVRSFGQTPRQLFVKPHPAHSLNFSVPTLGRLASTTLALQWTKQVPEAAEWLCMSADGSVVTLTSMQKPIPPVFNRYVLWGTWDNCLRLCSSETGKTKQILQPLHGNRVTAVHCTTTGNLLLVGDESGAIEVYNLKTASVEQRDLSEAQVALLRSHSGGVRCLASSSPFSVLLSGSEDCTAIIWDMNSLSYVRTLDQHESQVAHIAISDSTSDIVTACDCFDEETQQGTSRLRLWTVNATFVTATTSAARIECVAMTAFDPGCCQNVVIAGLANGQVWMWEAEQLQPVARLSEPSIEFPIVAVAIGPDGSCLLTSSEDGRIVCWSEVRSKRLTFRPGRLPGSPARVVVNSLGPSASPGRSSAHKRTSSV